MKNWTLLSFAEAYGLSTHVDMPSFCISELNALELRAWNAEELVRQAIAQGFKVGKNNLSSGVEGHAAVVADNAGSERAYADSLTEERENLRPIENQASTTQFIYDEIPTQTKAADGSLGNAVTESAEASNAPEKPREGTKCESTVQPLSPAPTITDEKREDDSGTVCPPRMSQEGNATAIPEKADLPGEVDLETNHLHLLADDHEVN